MEHAYRRILGTCASLLGCLGASALAADESSLDLTDRIACQAAIEEVYARHRLAASESSPAQQVPSHVVRRRAEDAVLKSVALQEFWGITLTPVQLQAELDRMSAHSQAPEVLRELFAAMGDNAGRAAECLARPLLADRIIRSQYSRDSRFHGELKARARKELEQSGDSLVSGNVSGAYAELEWRRGTSRTPGIIGLEPEAFDERVRELTRALGGDGGDIEIGQRSPLREEDGRFVALSVLAIGDDRLRLAVAEWPKRSFDDWWSEARRQVPFEAPDTAFAFELRSPQASNCRDDSWQPTQRLLDPRYWHTAVWTGSEMIVFGGMEAVGFVHGDGSRYDPATDTWRPVSSTNSPGAREAHVAVWTGREMVVWGGRGDAKGGRYDPVTDTWRSMATANAPTPRWYASVIWTGSKMLVWGGYGGPGVLNSGGVYDPVSNTWTAMAPAPLAPRAFHAAAWTGARMVIWGGYDGFIGQMYGDGARYDPAGNAWTPVAAANAPNARFYHTAVWTGSEVIVWGGINYPDYDLSGGRYNPVTNTWKPTSLVNAPSLRWMHAAVWTGSEMIVQGGTPDNPVGGRYRPATDTWTATSPLNAADNGQGITAVWTGTEMIVWGGLDDDSVFHFDGGRYDPAQDVWRRTGTMNVPTARGLHSGEWTGSEMIVWGGYSYGYPNTGGVYDPATDNWRPTSTAGAPAGRENATAVWTGTEAIFWGGDPDGFGVGSGGRYRPATDSWSLTSLANAPNNRYGHSAVWTGNEMIVFGGIGTDSVAKRYRPATNTWTDASIASAPGPRDHHAAVWTGSEMIIWGGFINDGSTPTGGRYNPASNTWRPTNVGSSPPTRMWPIGVWDGQEMIVWGGYDWLFGQYFNDGARYDPVGDSWTPTTLSGAPSPRVAQGVWTDSELLLWGGANDSSGGRYDPVDDSWRATTRVGAPQVLWGGRWSTVWTGDQMIVWGGMGPTQRGGLYCASGTPNANPVAANDSYSVPRNGRLVIGPGQGVLTNDTDANGDALSAVLLTNPLHGTLQFNANGSFTYRPTPGYSGKDSFGYRANDGLANSNRARVLITVQ